MGSSPPDSGQIPVDSLDQILYPVHTMNEMPPPSSEDLLGFQTARLEELITETVRCCEDRKLFESQKFGLPYAALKCLRLFNGQRYLTVKSHRPAAGRGQEPGDQDRRRSRRKGTGEPDRRSP